MADRPMDPRIPRPPSFPNKVPPAGAHRVPGGVPRPNPVGARRTPAGPAGTPGTPKIPGGYGQTGPPKTPGGYGQTGAPKTPGGYGQVGVQRNAPAPPIQGGPLHPAMRPIAKIGGMAATGGPAIQPGTPAPLIARIPRTSSR